MGRFKTKPAEIVAMQFDGTNLDELREYFNTENIYETAGSHPDVIYIVTVAGRSRASIGEWIIWEAPNCFSKCDPEEFAKRYEAIDEQ